MKTLNLGEQCAFCGEWYQDLGKRPGAVCAQCWPTVGAIEMAASQVAEELSLEVMIEFLGLTECSFKGESCDLCQRTGNEPRASARIFCELMGGENAGAVSQYVCEDCLPALHQEEQQRLKDDEEYALWAEENDPDLR